MQGNWKVTLEVWTHQHVHVKYPAVLSRTYTEAPEIQAVLVVEHFVQGVT